MWDTISSDGKYAIAWSANPANEDDPASDWVIDAATSDKILELTGLNYKRDRFRLETAWSADNRYLLVLLDVHYSRYDGTESVLLADTVTRKSVDLSPRISKIFSGKKDKAYLLYYHNPWFVDADRFLLEDGADKKFYFQFVNSGEKLSFIKSGSADSPLEWADRDLNRVYRKLHGLLSADDQKALVEEERAWLVKLDPIKSEKKKTEFVQARWEELLTRASKIISDREKADNQ
jgi:hypothetical protein